MHDVVEQVAGRGRELAELERLLSLATGGRPTTVLVQGPPGSGRTSLVETFLSRHDDATVLRGGGLSWEADLHLGVVEHLFAGHGWTGGDEQDVVTSLTGLLDKLQQAAPLVLVVDQVERADVASVQALVSALRWLREGQILLVLVSDLEEAVPPQLRATLDEAEGHRLRITGLDGPAVQRLAATTGVHLPLPTAYRLAAHTGGRPRLVLELLQEPGLDLAQRPPARLPAPRRTVADTRVRVEHCGADARALLEATAVLASPASLVHAAALSRVLDPVAAVDEAVRHGLLTVRDADGLPSVVFGDPLVRAAVYELLGPATRRELHHRAAEIVEDEGARLEHLAAAATGPDAALAAELVDYARRRAAAGAYADVADATIKASRLSPDRADREELLLRGVDALVAVGNLPRAVATAPEVEGLRETPLRDAVLGYLAVVRGRPSEAEALLDRAWELCNSDRHPEVAAQICQRRVLHSLGRWDGAAIVTWASRALELVSPPHPAAVEAMAILGLGQAISGDPAAARATYADLRGTVQDGAQVQRFRMAQGWLDLATDAPAAARRELESAVPADVGSGSVRISLWALAWLARAQFNLGDWGDALETVQRARILLDESELELLRPLVHWTGAQVRALRDEPEAALEHIRLGHADLQHYEAMLVPAALARAHVAEARPDYATVVRSLQPLTQLTVPGLDQPGFWPWQDVYANALVMTNRVDEADAFLVRHERLAAEHGHRSAMARAGYVRGRIHGARGDLRAARTAFEGALGRLEDLPLPYERARVEFAYGQTLRRAGKRRDADTLIDSARDLFAALGATAYLRRCDQELKAGGLRPGLGATGIGELTPQEGAVASLVAQGRSNRDVADQLFVSVKTVQFHLTRIYAKLGIRSRGELAARYRDSADDR